MVDLISQLPMFSFQELGEAPSSLYAAPNLPMAVPERSGLHSNEKSETEGLGH